MRPKDQPSCWGARTRISFDLANASLAPRLSVRLPTMILFSTPEQVRLTPESETVSLVCPACNSAVVGVGNQNP